MISFVCKYYLITLIWLQTRITLKNWHLGKVTSSSFEDAWHQAGKIVRKWEEECFCLSCSSSIAPCCLSNSQSYATQTVPAVVCKVVMFTPLLNQTHCLRKVFPHSWWSIFSNQMSVSIILEVTQFIACRLLRPGRNSADSADQQFYPLRHGKIGPMRKFICKLNSEEGLVKFMVDQSNILVEVSIKWLERAFKGRPRDQNSVCTWTPNRPQVANSPT